MKQTQHTHQKALYLSPEVIPFTVEPVKCFAVSGPSSYGNGGSLGDDEIEEGDYINY